MLEEGLSYPFNGENIIAKFLIGTGLWFFSWLLIPAIFLTGYYLAAMRAVINGDEAPPSFTDWGVYGVDGLKFALIYIVYSVIPLGIIMVVFGMGAALDAPMAGLGIVGIGVLLLVSLVVSYILPGVTAEYAATQSVSNAFDISKLSTLWASSEYVMAFLVSFVGGLVIGAGMMIGSFITLGLAIILYPVVMYYQYLFIAYLFAVAYRKVYGPGGGTMGTGDENSEYDPDIDF